MANIVYISKYPPLEGGIASKTYWLVNALARAGHTIHVVTDSLGVDENLTIPNADETPQTSRVIIHRADQVIPWHIPNDSHREISLLDKALEVAESESLDLIVGGYLVPYGIAAYQLSCSTGLPFVLLHGGSDINKFLLNDIWPHVLAQTLTRANLIITDNFTHNSIRQFSGDIMVLPPYVPDPSAFTNKTRPDHKTKTLAIIGKANFHWHHKSWQQILDLWNRLGEEFRFVIVSQGIGLENFKASVPQALDNKISWRSFVPPWRMSELLQAIDGLFHFREQLPFPVFSNTVLEAFACGTRIFSDSKEILNDYRRHGIDLSAGMAEAKLFSLLNSESSKDEVANYFSKKEDNFAWNCASAFDQYILSFERRLLATIDKS